MRVKFYSHTALKGRDTCKAIYFSASIFCFKDKSKQCTNLKKIDLYIVSVFF